MCKLYELVVCGADFGPYQCVRPSGHQGYHATYRDPEELAHSRLLKRVRAAADADE